MTAEGLSPAERPIAMTAAEPGDLSPPVDDITADPRALQILTTEHWSLLSARSLVYNEAFARAGMFLTFLSASLVALALAAQALTFGFEFLVLAAAILGVDTLIGVATWARVMDATVDDLRALHGMNRLRAGYAQIAPSILPYLVTSTHDDATGVFGAYGSRGVHRGLAALIHGLSTTSGMIGAIVTLMSGALTAIMALLLRVPAPLALALAAFVLVLVFTDLSRRSQRRIARYQASIVSHFPSPPES